MKILPTLICDKCGKVINDNDTIKHLGQDGGELYGFVTESNVSRKIELDFCGQCFLELVKTIKNDNR